MVLPYEEDCDLIKNGKYELADPLDFVNLIKHADYVLTDSFHGSIFSILYDKQFVVTKRTHVRRVSQTSRITFSSKYLIFKASIALGLMK